jgi:hypothetical protein
MYLLALLCVPCVISFFAVIVSDIILKHHIEREKREVAHTNDDDDDP